jgi:hypothetical protein
VSLLYTKCRLYALLLRLVCCYAHVLNAAAAAAQASIWDVDGTGMQQVPDADLDLALRKVRHAPLLMMFANRL